MYYTKYENNYYLYYSDEFDVSVEERPMLGLFNGLFACSSL